MIPANLDGFEPRMASFEGLVDADGLGTDPVDEDLVEDEGVAPVALDCGDQTSVTERCQGWAGSDIP